jgi:hypothetical protein
MDRKTREQLAAELRARQQAKLDECMERCPTTHPHLLRLVLDQGAMCLVECPGRDHCALWYGKDGGRCGVAVEADEVGSEFLEWMIGPPFVPSVVPFPIGFTWSGGGDDDPVELWWWPLPVPFVPDRSERLLNERLGVRP